MMMMVMLTAMTEEGGTELAGTYACLLEDFCVVFFSFPIIYTYCRIYLSTGFCAIRWYLFSAAMRNFSFTNSWWILSRDTRKMCLTWNQSYQKYHWTLCYCYLLPIKTTLSKLHFERTELLYHISNNLIRVK
jgi:hypothetical protein